MGKNNINPIEVEKMIAEKQKNTELMIAEVATLCNVFEYLPDRIFVTHVYAILQKRTYNNQLTYQNWEKLDNKGYEQAILQAMACDRTFDDKVSDLIEINEAISLELNGYWEQK